MPNPASGAINVAADSADERTPYSFGPRIRTTMTWVMNAKKAAINDPTHSDDSAFKVFLILINITSLDMKLVGRSYGAWPSASISSVDFF